MDPIISQLVELVLVALNGLSKREEEKRDDYKEESLNIETEECKLLSIVFD